MHKNLRASIIYLIVFVLLLALFGGLRLYNLGYFKTCLSAQVSPIQATCSYILASSLQTASFLSIPLSGILLVFIYLQSRGTKI